MEVPGTHNQLVFLWPYFLLKKNSSRTWSPQFCHSHSTLLEVGASMHTKYSQEGWAGTPACDCNWRIVWVLEVPWYNTFTRYFLGCHVG